MLFSKSKFFLNGLLFIYPASVFFLNDHVPAYVFIIIAVGALIAKACIPFPEHLQSLRKISTSLMTLVCLALIFSYLLSGDRATLYYPVFMSFSMACLFLMSLIYPPNLIACFAQIVTPRLDKEALRYTRKVTIVWTMFCFFNSLVAYQTVIIGDLSLWAAYNGCISYLLMGCLFVGEYGVRRYARGDK